MSLEKQDSYRLPIAVALLLLVRIEILCSELEFQLASRLR